jgi:phosphoribosyl 1,2-cyclic phosphodiesterase
MAWVLDQFFSEAEASSLAGRGGACLPFQRPAARGRAPRARRWTSTRPVVAGCCRIAEQFSEPITHLIYSHSHGDHASGGEVFGEVTAIAHADALGAIDRTNEPTTIKVGGKMLERVPLGPDTARTCW